MSVLSQKLDSASKQFQSHNFKKALELYEDCLHFCRNTDESASMINNILSSKGALQCIIGQYDAALATLNTVIKKDPINYLALMRRSQVYKKKNLLKKASKDLNKIYVFCPDNLQISALKVQIQNMILKSKQQISSDESDQEEDETASLNYSNLKKIDRSSVSIMFKNQKNRKSRVTILGDTTVSYDSEGHNNQGNELGYLLNHQQAHEKYLQTAKEIELDDQEDEYEPVPLKVKASSRGGKSILKNKGTSIFLKFDDGDKRASHVLGRDSKLVDLLRNIDGKVIQCAAKSQIPRKSRQVQFKKSLYPIQEIANEEKVEKLQIKVVKKEGRKSCLKRPSFQAPLNVGNGPRRSKFENLQVAQIDGHVLKEKKKQIESRNAERQDSDQGSQHNIFGDRPIVLSKQMRENLGLAGSQSDANPAKEPKQRTGGGRSILKSSSVLFLSSNVKKAQERMPTEQRKPKKSVMFSKTG